MKLIPPPFQKGQGFGENVDDAYHNAGLLGHPAIDYGGPQDWGKTVPNSAYGAVVSAILAPEGSTFYRAVNTIYEDTDGCYEIQYGHLNEISVKVGDILALGQKIGTLGNSGQVYGGNPFHQITDYEKSHGSRAGAHLHFQVREIKEVPWNDSSYAHYLNDGSGRLIMNGYAYAEPNFENGYNACVNPVRFYGNGQFLFLKNLYLGMRDPDVIELQKRLGVVPTYLGFGPKTFAAVIAFQKAHGLPPTGFCGPLTRNILNK